MAPGLRVRRSIRALELLENRKELDKLIRAFRGIQQLPPDDPNSFFVIAGYHGEPFEVQGKDVEWGGYCFHNAVLFPTWHRAYCLRIEDALRSIKGCEDVTLPYWDELAEDGNETPVPAILTSSEYVLDGKTIPNPLFSYALQKNLIDGPSQDRNTKHVNYSTVRFPLSGLVGTDEARDQTKVWNEKFSKPSEQLNWNIRNWLFGKVDLDPIEYVDVADTFSVVSRMRNCMKAPNWTVFSNKASAAEYAEKHGHDNKKEHWVVAIEEPHNAIHLALGGHYQPASWNLKKSPGYNANPKDFQGANGDMGCNETAAFDPIFFIHHGFIDYMMWCWQKKHKKTTRGSLEIDHYIESGTTMKEGGNAALPKGTKLEMTSPLKPFRKPNSDEYYTSDDLTDITELGYTYAPGSFEALGLTPKSVESSLDNFEPSSESVDVNQIVALQKTATVKVDKYSGSFVIRTYATVNGRKVEIGRDPILSRYNVDTCGNCQNSLEATSIVPIHKTLAEALDPDKTREIPYRVEIQYLGGQEEYRPVQRHGFASVEDQVIRY